MLYVKNATKVIQKGFEKYKDLYIAFFIPELYLRINQSVFNNDALAYIYHRFKENKTFDFSDTIQGAFSIVIIDNDKIYLSVDHRGLETLYYYVNNNKVIISDKLIQLKQYNKLSVNRLMLLQYFTYINDFTRDTLCLDVFKVLPHETIIINTQRVDVNIIQHSYYEKIINEYSIFCSEKKILKDIENQLENIIKLINTHSNGEIVNLFSGGVDSSLLQLFLDRNGIKNALTYLFDDDDKDLKYTTYMVNRFNLDQQIIRVDKDSYITSLIEGINICETPYMFNEFVMFQCTCGKYSNNIFISGNGADNIMGHGLLLFLTYYFKYPSYILYNINKIYNIEQLLSKYFRIKDLNGLYKLFRSNNFTKEYFENTVHRNNLDIIKKGFGIDSLSSLFKDLVDKINNNNNNYDIVSKVLIYHGYYTGQYWQDRISHKLAQANNNIVVFPYSDKEFNEYLINVPTRFKIKKLTNKYLAKKILTKYIPKEIIYRKKLGLITKNTSLYPYYDNNILNNYINEIKTREYNYFTFNYEEIFSKKSFESIALCLINFHIWHKKYID